MNRTAKRLDDPTLSNRAFAIFFIVTILIAIALLLAPKARAATKTWNNTGTDFNSAGSWTGGVPTGNGDTADFNVAKGTNPNLSASLTIKNITFSTTASSGYDLTSSNTSFKLTLVNASAIIASNTSGTNIIDAPIVLGAAAGTTQNFTQASGGTLIVNGVISNTNSITLGINGAGTVKLTGANTYTGGTTVSVSGGVLALGSSGVVGAGGTRTSGPVGTGTLTLADGVTLRSDSTTARTIQNDLSLSGNITLGDSTNSGQLTFNSTDGTNTLTTAATVTLTGNTTLTTSSAVVIADAISGNFTLTKAGSSTLTFSGSVANSYNGLTTVNAGELDLNKTAGTNAIAGNLTIGDGSGTDTVKLLASNQIADASAVQIDGTSGVLNLNNNSETIASLADRTGGTGTSGSVQLGTGTLTIAPGSGSTTFSGVISGTGGNLVKNGGGTQVLSGANSYSGATTVNNGTLTLDNNNTTTPRLVSTSGITVNSGGTLLLAQSGGTASTNRINNSATVNLGAGATPGTGGKLITGGLSEGTAPTGPAGAGGVVGLGALTLNANSVIDFNAIGSASTAGGSNLVFSSLSGFVSGTALTIAHWTGTAGADGLDRLLFVSNPGLSQTDLANMQFTNDAGGSFALGGLEISFNGYFELVPVPEPSTWIGGALAVGVLGWRLLKSGKLKRGKADEGKLVRRTV